MPSLGDIETDTDTSSAYSENIQSVNISGTRSQLRETTSQQATPARVTRSQVGYAARRRKALVPKKRRNVDEEVRYLQSLTKSKLIHILMFGKKFMWEILT